MSIKIILHIDLNKFFVRVEEIKNPSLIGKPVAIGGEGRGGIVSTCSYEARKYGVSSGMPMFKAKELCKNMIILPPDSEMIDLLSREFIAYIREYSEIVEQMSCDECFVDITESFKKYGNNDIYSYLRKIQNGLYNKTKLYCSIGVGPTKFLAKMGSDYKKPKGITIIRKKDIKNILFPLKVDSFYGIGKKTVPKLNELGIYTIGDLYYKLKLNLSDLDNLLIESKNYIISCLEGTSDDKVETNISKQKSIGTTRTLLKDSTNKEEIREFYNSLISRIIKEMKGSSLLCKTITLTLKNADCSTNFKVTTYSKTLKEYTDNEEIIRKSALDLFDKVYKDQNIRLIGFTVKNLIEKVDAVIQMTFDNYEMHEKESETFLIMSKINQKFKKDVLMRVSDLKRNGNK